MARKRTPTEPTTANLPDVTLAESQQLVIPGPALELLPGSVDMRMTPDNIATVLCTNLKRRLRADLERFGTLLRDDDEALAALRKQLAEATEAEKARLESTVTQADAYHRASRLMAAFGAFDEQLKLKLKTDVGVADEDALRRGEPGFLIRATVVVKTGTYSDDQFTATSTAPATARQHELLEQIATGTATRREHAKMAADFRRELDRPDLIDDCRTLVFEQAMERNPETSEWLGNLYGRLGLVIDSKPVREQLKLVAAS